MVYLTRKLSYTIKAQMALVPLTLSAASLPVVVYAYNNSSTGWIISNLLVAVIGKYLVLIFLGACIGLLSSIMFGIAGILGPKYMGTTNYGLSSAFLFSSFLSFVCLVSVGSNVLTDTILYFSIVITILLAVIVTIPVRINNITLADIHELSVYPILLKKSSTKKDGCRIWPSGLITTITAIK